jgi:hypothetical protein
MKYLYPQSEFLANEGSAALIQLKFGVLGSD